MKEENATKQEGRQCRHVTLRSSRADSAATSRYKPRYKLFVGNKMARCVAYQEGRQCRPPCQHDLPAKGCEGLQNGGNQNEANLNVVKRWQPKRGKHDVVIHSYAEGVAVKDVSNIWAHWLAGASVPLFPACNDSTRLLQLHSLHVAAIFHSFPLTAHLLHCDTTRQCPKIPIAYPRELLLQGLQQVSRNLCVCYMEKGKRNHSALLSVKSFVSKHEMRVL